MQSVGSYAEHKTLGHKVTAREGLSTLSVGIYAGHRHLCRA